jgi:hypothetical protein
VLAPQASTRSVSYKYQFIFLVSSSADTVTE